MKNLSEQKFREMIYAFSAGCLDKDERVDFLEYLKSGQRVPENELGELQNVVALLPAVLEIEVPQPHVKDMVAKRLYRMREELKLKKRQMVKDLTHGDVQPINENVFSEKVYEKPEVKPSLKTTGRMTVEAPLPREEKKKPGIIEVPYTELDKNEGGMNEEEASVPSMSGYNPRTMDILQTIPQEAEPAAAGAAEPISPKWVKEEHEYEEEEKSGRSFSNIMILSGILILVLIAGGVIYFMMNRQIRQGREQIASLSGQVNALNSEMLRLDRNQKVLAVLSAKDLKVINLDGADANSGGFGKLSLLQNGKEGVIQLYNMPHLKDSSVYQLWLKSNEHYYSLGTFRTKREVEYFPFSVPEVEPGKTDSYIVTLESAEGRTTPSDKVYLTTTINGR